MKQYVSFTTMSLLYAFRTVLGCAIVWLLFNWLKLEKMEWALISVIIVSEPDFGNLRNAITSRIVNTVMGCAIGAVCILVVGVTVWSLLVGVTVSVLISTSFKQYPSAWKLAPATVSIVMAPAVMEHAPWREAIATALTRTGEVLLGCFVAFALGFIFSTIRRWRNPPSLSE
ncbi:FUSC family protein [Hymenobacter cavernae]|uniref:Integral membrane bound transporter domain-containing protein n=1 Tax=Hymenobacter cavernae TaxID=2044852 RepID=A0ABQ1TXM1_9BACT|nr:FUSC family protein [Hymenobacter cavernae]GGF06326.1 hypothetical protein GCM10011383_16740 [Hymenobacter cavernae]